MQIRRNRKYPIQFKKASTEVEIEPKSIDLSMATAAGIVAAVFISGLISGWMIRRRW